MRHEIGYVWIETINAKKKRIGLSHQGLEKLGTISWIEFPKIGEIIDQHVPLFTLEASKAAIEVESPVKGTIVHVKTCDDRLLQALNEDPDHEWLIELVTQ